MFDVPIVLLMFKREKIVDIINRVREVKPQKVYLVCDGGRTEDEHKEVCRCRQMAEQAIDWKCEIIKNYSETNRGVYENIAGGAKWVFSQEKYAIFLEDDNLPEVSFFQFCKEMLEKYENDNNVLWVCGTNYLGDYEPSESVSYMFTKHMLPCGWASWSNKFLSMYDGAMTGFDNEEVMSKIKRQFLSQTLYRQSKSYWESEWNRMLQGKKTNSWDMQMDYSIKKNSVYGICPTKNQIKNIGVDNASIHGGISMSALMTRRFCGMDSYPIQFPLKHPKEIAIDIEFEKKLGTIILRPFPLRVKRLVDKVIRNILQIPDGIRTREYLLKKRVK